MGLSKLFKKKNPKSQNTSAVQNDQSTKQIPLSDIGPEQLGIVVANSTNPAYQEAWNQHWMTLDKSEWDDWSFKRIPSPSQVQKTIQDMDKLHRKMNPSRRVADPMLRFFKAIETVMAGAVIGIQAYPEVSSIVVGVVRVIINVAMNYFNYYVKLSKLLEELVDDIEVLDRYTRDNAKSPELHETLVALYTNILAFCRHARRVFCIQDQERSLSSFAVLVKVQWAPFEEEFGEIRSNLNRYTAKLGRLTAVITMNTALDIKEELKNTSSTHAQNERKEFLDWICKDKIEEIHNIVRKQRLADTGSFIFKNKAYLTWVSEQNTRPLWIYGAAGTGKSVIASMIIDHLSQGGDQNNHTVAYVYIKGEDTDLRSSPDRMVSMLIKQLCWKLKTLPDETLHYYRQCKKDARLPVLDKLTAMFVECVGSLSHAFVIIDGLDECEEKFRKPILDFVCATSQQSNSKFLVTSRWEWDIKRAFSRIKSLVIPNITSDQKDIVKVVRHRVEKELGHLSSDTQEFIIQQLVEKSNGIFLWITFQLDDLSQVLESDIKTQLSLLPSNLQATYVQIFQKINKQPATSRRLAQRCFLWSFHTEVLLSSDDFRDAVGLVNEHEKIKYDESELTAVTKKLIRVTNFGLQRVRPIHFSLKEFVVDSQSGLPLELQDMIPDTETANARMASECLRHLLADIPNDHFLGNILSYCANHFDTHIRRLTTIPEEVLQMLDRVLLTGEQRLLKFLSWRWPIEINGEMWPDFACVGNPQSIDPLFFLRSTRLYQIPTIQARYATIERIEIYPHDYLHVATMAGLEDIVSELLEQGADPDKVDTEYFTPLQVLCLEKSVFSEKIATMLLKAGADPDKVTTDDRSAYSLAQYFKREEYLRILNQFRSANKD